MNPDQIAPLRSSLNLVHFFSISATKVHKQKRKQTTIAENSGVKGKNNSRSLFYLGLLMGKRSVSILGD